MSKVTRFNPKKRGSFKISLEFSDWELSITIGAIAHEIRRLQMGDVKLRNKAHLTYLKKLRTKYGKALGQVLKAEFRDLKLKEGQKELSEG